MARICISGTPGTGKSEIGRRLAKTLGWEFVELNTMAKDKGCIAGWDKERKTEEVDIDKLAKEVDKIKENCVLESHYAHYMPCDVVIILRTNPKELRKRMGERDWPDKKIEENVQAEIMEVCKTEALDLGRTVYEVDTTRKKPEEVIEEILKFINPYIK
jgi:adenylate kinase